MFGFSGVVTPPASDDGCVAGSDNGCPTSVATTEDTASIVNNPISLRTSPISPPSPPTSIKTRRDRSSLQREANRSIQFTTRLQRSATTESSNLRRKKPNRFRRPTTSLPADSGLKALEPLHEQNLTKMAFAEQQQWITVQQKTFTKWYA